MTQPEFSKGLEIVPANENHGFYLVDEADLPVCDFYFANPSASTGDSYVHQFHNAEANARLFAAAPEFYEAVERSEDTISAQAKMIDRLTERLMDHGWQPDDMDHTERNCQLQDSDYTSDMNQIALAKARGEQS